MTTNKTLQSRKEYSNVFDTLDDDSPPQLTASVRHSNEITQYLKEPREKPENVLLWWIEHQQVYPRLSMALDYLTIPGMIFLDVA